MYGPLSQDAIADITSAVDDYKLDGAVFWAFLGCRHTCATIKIVKEALAEKDIPMLTIDCDIVDPTVNSEADIRSKLEQFFELLGDR
jgi:benzoyl-CoA reductase/2-hydroxyglutaryl-CoA dehydratase subunit BcrC/BadD/HgdB